MTAPKNPAAVALGRLGGRRSAETGAVRRNGSKGGRPREPKPCIRECGRVTSARTAGGRPMCQVCQAERPKAREGR